jgi:hypothetical protein
MACSKVVWKKELMIHMIGSMNFWQKYRYLAREITDSDRANIEIKQVPLFAFEAVDSLAISLENRCE